MQDVGVIYDELMVAIEGFDVKWHVYVREFIAGAIKENPKDFQRLTSGRVIDKQLKELGESMKAEELKKIIDESKQ
jgi:hypothetical protein